MLEKFPLDQDQAELIFRLTPKAALASLVTQLVKNLLAMQETWLRSLGWEDPLEKGPAKSLINKDLKSDRKLLVSNSALGNILCCLKYKILTIV